MAVRLRKWWPDETDRTNLGIIVVSGIIFLLVTTGFTAIGGQSVLPISQSSPSSWNHSVSCHPIILTIEQLIGSTPNPGQHAPNQGADYTGGKLLLSGASAPGLNPSSSLWPFSKRSTSPPCSALSPDGKTMQTLVEIHNVKVMGISSDECGSIYPGICDQTFNVCNDVVAAPCGSTYPTTMHKIHVEIDMQWLHAKIAPSVPTPGSYIDLQGFAFWDDAHLGEGWHSFSGWEIHPLTAWRPVAHTPTHAPESLAYQNSYAVLDQERLD